ncbi:MAG: hypothetical protein ACX93U_00085 [Salipiger thiooxidans]|uniref:hypothetical protein n=1 Tax=Salipiger thiooxidans TaxID=282683 RepID=UPI001CFBED9C|nr:hypothetical protein [Salipiger thiooxidans]
MTGYDDLIARLDALEMAIQRLSETGADALTGALHRAMRNEWVTAGELWRHAASLDLEAEVEGRPRPELAEALERAGIVSAHGLGRWLAKREGQGFERGAVERGGIQWRAMW